MLLRCLFMATKDRSNNNNLRALFSVICLCIIALGLVVYFSMNSKNTTDVNEATTVVETKTTAVQRAITTRLEASSTTAVQTTGSENVTKKKKKPTTEAPTMEAGETNTPYKSFYKYPCNETVLNGYTQELVLNDTMGDYRSHTAIDFKCAAGSKVVAINDGLVMSVEKDNLLGNVIKIDHGGKLIACYCGMDAVNVSQGDYVTIGQTLGAVGKVPFEAKQQAHLHFETILDGKHVNPLDVMGKTE